MWPSDDTDEALSSRRNTRTLEAFSEAIDHEIRLFYKWCANKEEEICRAQSGVGPPSIVSLLNLEKAIQDAFSGSFTTLADILRKVLSHRASQPPESLTELWILPELPSRVPPASVTAFLLDNLFQATQEHLSMGDHVTSNALMRAFAKTAEPVWSMAGLWLKNGIPVRDPSGFRGSYEDESLDREFFIEDNELPLLDPDFWREGYTLRDSIAEEDGSRTVPVFLAHVVEHVLGSGKAVGLLRTLGIQPVFNDNHVWLSDWRSFTTLLAEEAQRHPESITRKDAIFSVSTDTLSRIVFDELVPHCQVVAAQLAKVLVDECSLWKHLSTIENLFLMRKGDVMTHFADVLFSKVCVPFALIPLR